jgi:hypothetical protein
MNRFIYPSPDGRTASIAVWPIRLSGRVASSFQLFEFYPP